MTQQRRIKISDIVEVLSTPYAERLDSTILALLEGIETHTEQIRTVATKAVSYDQIPYHSNEVRDLQNTIDAVYLNETRNLMTTIEQMKPLMEQRDYIRQIKLCFAVSNMIYPKGYQIISAKICQQMTYDAICSIYHIHRSSIRTIERKHLRIMALLYALSATTVDLPGEFLRRKDEGSLELDDIIANPKGFLDKEEEQMIHWKEYWDK